MPTFDAILKAARRVGASDIHIVAGLPPAFRVDGEIIAGNCDALTRDEARELTLELLSKEQREAFEREREFCFSYQDPSGDRFRITAYFHAGSPEVSIRLCDKSLPTSEELGLPPVVDELARRSHGLVLVTGPTGVGKTTTLNYMVDLINQERRCKIVTIEDPVEFVHRPRRAIVVQQEVHTDTPSFGRALRHVLRQDPDVIVIGEMRDVETISTALVAAETGHLVLATLHTSSAHQAVERIMGAMHAEQANQAVTQLADSLQGILVQELLPRADKKGRVLAMEVLIPTPGIRSIIRDRNFHLLPTAIQTGGAEGMKLMDAALQDLHATGEITCDVALSHARNASLMKQRMNGRRATSP